MINRAKVEKILKESGYKLTNQRKAILDVLFEHSNHFLSAEEIYVRAKEKASQTNFSTIYRNLETFLRLDIIHKTSIHPDASSYGLTCHDSHHHHIICKGCGKTEVLDFCPLEDIKDKNKHKNFDLTDHKFELYGYCMNCQAPGSGKD